MSKPKVLVVYKQSVFKRFFSTPKSLKGLGKGGYMEVVRGSHDRHYGALKTVREVLEEKGIGTVLVLRDRIASVGDVDRLFDWVVSVGGDGTFLDASHFIRRVPILGVNSDPVRSVARYSGCDGASFRRTVDGWMRGTVREVPVQRLRFSLNGKPCPWPVLNDLLVATGSPAGTSRYALSSGGKVEDQMSSGIWISTAAGSTAAILSAGGRRLPAPSRKFQFVVREAYHKKFGPRRLLKGVLGKGKELRVVSYMKEGRVFVDGANLTMPFGLGDRLAVRLSDRPLRIIGLKP